MRSRIAVITLLFVALLALVGCDSGGLPTAGSTKAEPVDVEMFVAAVAPATAESFEPGQEVRAKESGALIGTIVAVESTAAVVPVGDSNGELQAARSPITRDVRLTVESKAVVSEAGYKFDGEFQYINASRIFLTPYTQFQGMISTMETARE